MYTNLDGEAPLITDPQANSFNNLSIFFNVWHMSHDTWHMKHDTWHMTCNMWHTPVGGEVNQLPSFYRFRVNMLWRFGGKGWLSWLMNESVTQRQKYNGSAGALLPRKFLRVRKVFALNILFSIISGTCLENHWGFWKVSESSGKFPDCLERFWIVLKVSELSWKFGYCLEISRIV